MFRQITSIAGPHFGEIRNIKPPLIGPIIVNSIIDFGKHTDQLGIRRANENGIVGDGFPVPPHTHLQIQWDGKPVPYEENRYRVLRQIPISRSAYYRR